MEEQVNSVVEGLLKDVAAAQRESLARANVLAKVRLNPPARRSFSARLLARLPRLRFVLPTLAAAGLCAIWLAERSVPLTFAISNGNPGALVATGAGTLGDALQAPADGRVSLTFSDGSSVTLGRQARARVIDLDARGATVQVENGHVDISVHHRANTRWRVRAGTFEVTVTGTRFSVDWDNGIEALTVTMSEGTVEVRGGQLPGGAPVAVTAGQKFHGSARESRWVLGTAVPGVAEIAVAASGTRPVVPIEPAAQKTQASDETSPEAPPAAVTHGTPAASSRSWQASARAGHYQEALQLAERLGFEKACRKLSADDLVQLGDVARLARDAGRADQAYQAARRRFPRNDRPAFAMGLVAFEQRQDFRAAAKWFEVYVRQYPKGALAREALGREMESWQRAGESARARRVARQYVDQTPTGPYAPLARQILSP